jgi:hypothetical protein
MRSAFVLALSLCAGCGGAAPPPPEAAAAPEVSAAAPEADTPAPSAEAEGKTKSDEVSRQIPTKCATEEGKLCLPPPEFVKRLCQGYHPDVAFAMLAKGTPFTRGYLARTTEAWNASGGASSSGKLVLDEEVLVLSHRVPDTGGMVVSGSGGGYDVLRWDGTCASLMAEEVRFRVPAKPKSAPIPWKDLPVKTREALEADEKVGQAVAERRKECKGATMGSVSDKCEKADKKMSAVIVEHLRSGGTVPAPAPLP